MIIKSSQRSAGKQLAAHLASTENESATLINSSGVYSQDIAGAISEFEAIAKSSIAKKPLYHVSISPSETVNMSHDDWVKTWLLHDTIQRLSGLQFIEVEHVKKGRTHRHRVYNRINAETGKALNLSWTRVKNERIARQLEIELGHKVITGKHNRSVIRALKNDGLTEIANKLAPLIDSKLSVVTLTHSECQQHKDKKLLFEIRRLLSEAWNESENEGNLKEALNERGLTVQQGIKSIIVTDSKNNVYPLLRNINAARKALNKSTIKKIDLVSAFNNNTSPKYIATPRINYNITKKVTEINIRESTYSNSIEPNNFIRHKWIDYRESLLIKYYKDIEVTQLAQYWKIHHLQDGSLKLSNKNGNIFDNGSVISTDSKNYDITAKTMIKLALVKGWEQVRANGDDDYKLAIYKEAILNNIECLYDNQDDYHIWLQAEREINHAKLTSNLKL